MRTALGEFFELEKRGSTISRELRGAAATFLTMTYILFVNPLILAEAGVPRESAIACTAVAAGVCCILMGLLSNFPLALASGMGLNAVLASLVTSGSVASWQTAMGLVVLDGLIVLLLVLCGMREAVMNAIPRDLRRAIGAGIGLFIAFIGLVNARIVIVPASTVKVLSQVPSATLPPVTFGNLQDPGTAVAVIGTLLTGFLIARRVRGALVLGILFCTALALALGLTKLPDTWNAPSLANAFQADVRSALSLRLLPFLLAFVMVDFFDTLGTVTAIADQAGLQSETGRIPGLRNILLVDALSACLGGFLGASSVTAYIESAAGVSEGARTGLHSVIVGLLFLLAVFAAPLAAIVPAVATAPALILVGFLMGSQIAAIDFTERETAIPAFLTLVALPLTYSIAHGVGYGFVSYVVIKLLVGKWLEVSWVMYLVAGLFVVYFIWGTA